MVFRAGTKVFEEALNAVKFLGWLKKFGPAQNLLGPVKGQGNRLCPVDEKKCLGMKFNLHRNLKISNTNSKFFCLIVAV